MTQHAIEDKVKNNKAQNQENKILNGKEVSKALLAKLKSELSALQATGAEPPKLVVILVGEDPASQVYTRRKAKVAQEIGMASELLVLPKNTEEATLLEVIKKQNDDPAVHAILIQLPLPKHLNESRILNAVLPAKDVDGFHPVNLGRLLSGDIPPALPCTPAGIMKILAFYNVPISGKHAVIIGRSTIVGKPMGLLLLNANATVTYCHSRTENLSEICAQADILVAAVGHPEMITAEYVKPGAVVIDVGINHINIPETDKTRLVGDVAFDEVSAKVSLITPVPGGVGPMTIATLMANTLALYKTQQS